MPTTPASAMVRPPSVMRNRPNAGHHHHERAEQGGRGRTPNTPTRRRASWKAGWLPEALRRRAEPLIVGKSRPTPEQPERPELNGDAQADPQQVVAGRAWIIPRPLFAPLRSSSAVALTGRAVPPWVSARARALVEAGQTFPVLHHSAVAEPGLAESVVTSLARAAVKLSRTVCLPSSRARASRAKARPPRAAHCSILVGIIGAVAQRQQRAVEGIAVEFEQSGLLGQGTCFDQTAGALSAFVELEPGLGFGQAGLGLFMRAETFCQCAGHDSFPRHDLCSRSGEPGIVRDASYSRGDSAGVAKGFTMGLLMKGRAGKNNRAD